MSSVSQTNSPSTPTSDSVCRRSVGVKCNRHRKSLRCSFACFQAPHRPGTDQAGLKAFVRSGQEFSTHRYRNIPRWNVRALDKGSQCADVSTDAGPCTELSVLGVPGETHVAPDWVSRAHSSLWPPSRVIVNVELHTPCAVFAAHFIFKIGRNQPRHQESECTSDNQPYMLGFNELRSRRNVALTRQKTFLEKLPVQRSRIMLDGIQSLLFNYVIN